MRAKTNESEVPLSRKINHDLRAQLVNVKGFSGEIERSVSELEFIQCEISDLDPGVAERLDSLINDDLLPCIRFLKLSTAKLDDVVEKIRASALESES